MSLTDLGSLHTNHLNEINAGGSLGGHVVKRGAFLHKIADVSDVNSDLKVAWD